MRVLLTILALALGSCGGSPSGPDEQPISDPPASGHVTLDLSGVVIGPDGRAASEAKIQYAHCYCDAGICVVPTCDFYTETVTGLNGRYTLIQPVDCLFDRIVDGARLIVRGLANGECWGGRSEDQIICTSQPQAIDVRLTVSAPPESCQ